MFLEIKVKIINADEGCYSRVASGHRHYVFRMLAESDDI